MIHKYNSDNGSFIEECRKIFNVSEDGSVDFSTEYKNISLNLNDLTASKLGVKIQFLA